MHIDTDLTLETLINCSDSVGIVAHDAGGANILNAFIKRFRDCNFYLLIEGPALSIFDSKNVYVVRDESVFFESVSFVLLGTGSTSFEKKALRKARDFGLKTAVILDHFVNYKARFVDAGKVVFPDYCFVCDAFSAELARRELAPYANIYVCENYLASFISAKLKLSGVENPKHVLYVLENINETWDLELSPWEVGFKNFYDNFYTHSKLQQIIVRPHPKDDPSTYEKLKKYKEVHFDYSTSPIVTLGRVSTVVGVESYLLYLAYTCGLDVYTSLPSYIRNPRIPSFSYKVIS